MLTTKFTEEQLQNFFSGNYFHKAYNETVELAAKIKVHSDGECPEDLIDERRPSESMAVKDYRKKIWEPITKPVFSKINTSLNKIRRSSDWSIKYEPSKANERVPAGETLSDYCENNFPFFTSLTNWAFGVLLKNYLVDANTLVCVYPIQEEVAANEFLKPFPFIFNSDNVIEYIEGDYAVVKSTDKVMYTENNVQKWGDCYYILTTASVQRWEQYTSENDYKLAWEYPHALGVLPVVKAKRLVQKSFGWQFYFESRLNAIIPRLNEALREYSDLQAEVVQHIFSEKWEFISHECNECKGTGVVKGTGFAGKEIACHTCEGSGNKKRGPYSTLELKPPMAGEAIMPTPPIGYVQKQIDIVKIQDERIDKHIYQALASINMEFLVNTPMAQSGVAKEVDRDELNNFVSSIAEDIVAILDSIYYFINEYRYKILISNQDERINMLPSIAVPEKFDILSTNYLETELQNAKNNKVNPVIVNALEIEYANKKFNNDSSIRDKVALILQLDPLAGISEDDKMVRFNNNWITKENAIISANIQEFVSRAIEEKGQAFFDMDLKDKKKMILEYAKQQIKDSSSSAEILGDTEKDDVLNDAKTIADGN
ncbi:MAG: zinc finger-like domain-containing protein [Chitinophagaceae bacterium]|nr:zinc finger-like domain-containing protein [Chitinophagaceae bacterium]